MTPIVIPFNGKTPIIDPTAFIAPGAVIIGDVTISAEASVWYGCILRGDTNAIVIGERSNVQDGTVIHLDHPSQGGTPMLIGSDVLIGHRCLLHGCTVEDQGFVGMGSTMLNGSKVETGGMLAAGAFLGPGKTVPAGQMWGGLPARKMRDLREGEDKYALFGAAHYVEQSNAHAKAIAAMGQTQGLSEESF